MKPPTLKRCAFFAAQLLLRAMLVHPLAAGLAMLRRALWGA